MGLGSVVARNYAGRIGARGESWRRFGQRRRWWRRRNKRLRRRWRPYRNICHSWRWTEHVSTGVGTGGNGLNLGIGGNNGPLITTNQDGGTTSANVNLGLGDAGLGDLQDLFNDLTGTAGDALDGVDVGDLVGGAGGGAAVLELAFASPSPGEQQFLRLRCRVVLSSPQAFDKSTVALCRMIAKL